MMESEGSRSQQCLNTAEGSIKRRTENWQRNPVACEWNDRREGAHDPVFNIGELLPTIILRGEKERKRKGKERKVQRKHRESRLEGKKQTPYLCLIKHSHTNTDRFTKNKHIIRSKFRLARLINKLRFNKSVIFLYISNNQKMYRS